ncbi:transporter substrate-binding domain-containing protein [Stutzerimonas urumqiensis]|uniref:substrate-binding periplasmic protein n=1 Tax=Stutzerimonas urumqiensis TaxID=638269 RepID=UPI000EAF119A|nr:transporter substrate-binding domain-containing protein [Stutzerimonas urumqiensis]
MRRFLLVLLGWLCCAGVSLAQVQPRPYDDIIASGVLKVAVYDQFPPYSYRVEGEPRGVDVDLARALANGLGLTVEWLWVVPGETLDDDLRNFVWKGHYLRPDVLADLMMRIPYDREYAYRRNELGELVNEQVVMFGPYQRERWQVAHDVRRLAEVPSVAVFQYHPIGVEVESVPSFYLTSVFGGRMSGMTHHYPTPRAAFEAMQAGEVDAVMAMRAEVDWLLHQAQDEHLRRADNAYPDMGQQAWDLGMAVHESNRQLAYALEGLLDPMIRAGDLEALYARHGVRYELPGLYQDVQAN